MNKQGLIEYHKQALLELKKAEEEYEKLDEDGNRFNNRINGFCKRGLSHETALYLLENNIKYETGAQNGSIKMGKFIYFTSTFRWRVEGKKTYYWSKGIEDFVRRFLNEKKENIE